MTVLVVSILLVAMILTVASCMKCFSPSSPPPRKFGVGKSTANFDNARPSEGCAGMVPSCARNVNVVL